MNDKTNWGKFRHTAIEGLLYFLMALLASVQTDLGTEESYKYMNPKARFWTMLAIGGFLTGFNALKAFRSMTFGRAYGNPPEPTVQIQPTTAIATVEQKPNEKTNSIP